MIRYYIIYFLVLCSFCCCKKPFITVTRSSERPIPEKVIYPPEKSELAAMEIGDTINIFYKKTGWFSTSAYANLFENITYYSMETIWREDTSKYFYTVRWGYPEEWFGKAQEFNSLKNDPSELYSTIGKLEYACWYDTIINWDGNYQSCIRSFSHAPKDSIYFTTMSSRELTSERFQKWRFSPPTNEELNNLRENITSSSRFYFHEILLVSKDTIKVSYSEKCSVSFPVVYLR